MMRRQSWASVERAERFVAVLEQSERAVFVLTSDSWDRWSAFVCSSQHR